MAQKGVVVLDVEKEATYSCAERRATGARDAGWVNLEEKKDMCV